MASFVTLGEIFNRYKLNAICLDCSRSKELDVGELIDLYGKQFQIPMLSRIYRCSVCSSPNGCAVDLCLNNPPTAS